MTKRLFNLVKVLGLVIGLILAYIVYSSEYTDSKEMYQPALNFDLPLDVKANQVGFYVAKSYHTKGDGNDFWEFVLVTPRGIELVLTEKNVINSLKVYKEKGLYGSEVFATEEEALINISALADEHYLKLRLGK